jgi:protein phosphatase
LFGQYLSLLYYRPRCRPWDAATDRVWIGRRLNENEAALAVQQGVSTVVDLTVEFSEARPFCELQYLHLPVLDLTAPSNDQLHRAVAFIDEQAQQGIVYVHCKIGYSRSAAVVGAYLLAAGQVHTSDAAMAHLRNVRPSIVIRPEAAAALRSFEQCITNGAG